MRRAAIRELLDGFFDGSEEQLMVFLRNSGKVPAAAAAAAPEVDGRIDTVLL
jgi:hypothetical protein